MGKTTIEEIKRQLESISGLLERLDEEANAADECKDDVEELTDKDLEEISDFCRDQSKELSYTEALEHLSLAFRSIRKLLNEVERLKEKADILETRLDIVSQPYNPWPQVQPYRPYTYPDPESPFTDPYPPMYPKVWYETKTSSDWKNPYTPVTSSIHTYCNTDKH